MARDRLSPDNTDPTVIMIVHRMLLRRFKPLGAARQLSYQYRIVGGTYTIEEEIEYWKRQGAMILGDRVEFNEERDGGLPKWMRPKPLDVSYGQPRKRRKPSGIPETA